MLAEIFAKCYTYEEAIRKLTIGANDEDKGGIPIFQVAWIWVEETITTESAFTPASWTLAVNPEVMKFCPFKVTVGLLTDIDVTEG